MLALLLEIRLFNTAFNHLCLRPTIDLTTMGRLWKLALVGCAMRLIAWKFAVLLVVALSVGCGMESSPNVKGSGIAASVTRVVEDFSQVELYGVGELRVLPGDKLELVIEADDNMLENVQSTVTQGTLRLGVGSGTYVWNTGYPRMQLETMRAKSYKLDGQTGLKLEEANMDSLNLATSGQNTIYLSGVVGELTLELNGQVSLDASNAEIGKITGSIDGQCFVKLKKGVDLQATVNADSTIETVEAIGE